MVDDSRIIRSDKGGFYISKRNHYMSRKYSLTRADTVFTTCVICVDSALDAIFNNSIVGVANELCYQLAKLPGISMSVRIRLTIIVHITYICHYQ